MGWTGTHRDKGLSDREFFEQEFPVGLKEHGRILDCATVGSTFYAVIQNNEHAGGIQAGEAWMLVVLIQRTRDYYNITYKEMSESMGPNEARCPRRLLELLERVAPEPAGEYGADWRARCWANVRVTERATKVTRGTVIYFDPPVKFTNGAEHDHLTFQERSTFTSDTGGRYRVTSWRTNTRSSLEAPRTPEPDPEPEPDRELQPALARWADDGGPDYGGAVDGLGHVFSDCDGGL